MAINILLQISLFSEWIEAMVIILCCNSTLKQHYEDDFMQNCLQVFPRTWGAKLWSGASASLL